MQNEQPRAVSAVAFVAILLGLGLMALSFHASGPDWSAQVTQLEQAAVAADMIWGAI